MSKIKPSIIVAQQKLNGQSEENGRSRCKGVRYCPAMLASFAETWHTIKTVK